MSSGYERGFEDAVDLLEQTIIESMKKLQKEVERIKVAVKEGKIEQLKKNLFL